MRRIFTLILLALYFNVSGQRIQSIGSAHASLDVSNINAMVLTGGDFFNDLTPPYRNPNTHGNPRFEVPRGSGKHSIYASALWLGGKDAGGQLYTATQTYRKWGDIGFWPGPVAANHTPAHTSKYDKIWKISKTEIDQHIANFKDVSYKIPADIMNWPGNGNINNGEAALLAPFADRNNDGIYSPKLGDYPLIKGDQALYTILNDKGNIKHPLTPTMNAEIHIMIYGYDNPTNVAVHNTVFAEYRIFNRGQINFQDFYAGIWSDFDLGYFNDDLVGCDTINNRYFVYNGDDNDEGPDGYGLNPPIQSVTFLDQKMSSFLYYQNYGSATDGNPHPDISKDFYNYLTSTWRNNKLVTYGGDGTNQKKRPTKYMFPGDPDTKQGWSEKNIYPDSTLVENKPADRRGIGSIGPFNLSAGAELKFTVAYTYTRLSVGGEAVSCNMLARQDAQTLRKFHSEMKPELVVPISKGALLWPNPTRDIIQFALPGETGTGKATIQVTDNVGKTVYVATYETENGRSLPVNLSILRKGIYMVTITSGNQVFKEKLVKL